MHAGVKASVTPPTNTDAPAQFSTIRYFPGNQSKYCYLLNNVQPGDAYLVRASFWAGDSLPYETRVQNSVSFKLLLGADEWDDIFISLPQTNWAVFKEIYVVAIHKTIDVCVAGNDNDMDIPFISSLVLRPLNISMAPVQLMTKRAGRYLSYVQRINYGALSADIISYLGDETGDFYDRIWKPDTRNSISTTAAVNIFSPDLPPLRVMQTAYESSDTLTLPFPVQSGYYYYFSIYYSELSLSVTLPGQRVFNLEVSNGTGSTFGEVLVDPFNETHKTHYSELMIYSTVPCYVGDEGILIFSFSKASGSIYGPIVCGLELLQISNNDMSLGTDSDDAANLKAITSFYPVLNTWSGDPCLPSPYAYNWLTCSRDVRPFIITIALSNSGRAGKISTGFNNFKSLAKLSLADNSLSGLIPDLHLLQNLEALELQGNNLSGPIPDYLGELSALVTFVAGNPSLCNGNNNEEYCGEPSPNFNIKKSNKKKGNVALVIGGAFAGVIGAFIAVGLLTFCVVKRRKSFVMENNPSNNQASTHQQDDHHENALGHGIVLERPTEAEVFTFEAIKKMTRNFETELGKGGFGPVYYGVLENGGEVAVKIAKWSHQGEREFLNEVKFLSRVHHHNLVRLLGYCTESHLVLVYEFMANRSLFEALHGTGSILVLWKDRLNVAVGAAKGLHYLHQGCSPSIIHRDIKSGNILVNDQFEGKISDFGISKTKLYTSGTEESSQTLTALRGSPGYLDPVYAETNVANHSIDVYAFGIVLFELITGKPPLMKQMIRGGETQHILKWAQPWIEQRDLSHLVDRRLYQDFDVLSMWKVIELAIKCVRHDRRTRPTMTEIMAELESASFMEHNKQQSFETNSSDQRTASEYTMDVGAR